MTNLKRENIAGEGWKTVPDGGGSVLIAEMTTDPDTFEVIHVFDLGRPAAVYVTATVTAADPDGEEWGHGDNTDENAGRITIDIEYIEQSGDGVTWSKPGGVSVYMLNNGTDGWMRDLQYRGEGGDTDLSDGTIPGNLPLLTHEMVGVAARYVRIKGRVCEDYLLNTYSGGNHPSATWVVAVKYA